MLSQHKVIDQKPFVFVDQLGSNAGSSVEFGLEFLNVHVMYPANVLHEDLDGVLGQVSRQVLPDQASLLREHYQSVAVQNC